MSEGCAEFGLEAEELSLSRGVLENALAQIRNLWAFSKAEKTQEIFYLKITGELTFKEIGEILEISENLARVKFYRGKQKIKEVDDNEKK